MSAPAFLTSILPQPLRSPDDTRPYVTLTFAQSLDARIAGRDGAQLILSGEESMIMTHWMRTMHDAIMIGIGTAMNDDPQLNTRHLPPQGAPYPSPQPVILDSSLRLRPSCKLLENYRQDTGRQPWVFCAPLREQDLGMLARRTALLSAGAVIYEVQRDETDQLSLAAVMLKLRTLGIRSLMVEGGQGIISSFFSYRTPTIVGPAGVGVGFVESGKLPRLRHVRSETMGRDSVVACLLEEPLSPKFL